MKYIYKHGNQYWYQRAVPVNLYSILGKKTLKISLKTNKIPIAIKRAKLQALEHKKMFGDLSKKSKKILKKLFGKNSFDLKKYTLEFMDDYDDLVNKLLYSKSELIDFFSNVSRQEIENKSLDKILLDSSNNQNSLLLSKVFGEYLELKKIDNNIIKLSTIKKSISLMIEICSDKPLMEYSSFDAKIFRNHFIKLRKISTGRRHQSNIQNLFSVLFKKYSIEKKNPFSALKWPEYKKSKLVESFSIEELKKLKSFCLENNELVNLVCGLIFDTGCSFNEILGLNNEDIDLDKYNAYIVIRSNSNRSINNIYKRRTIPLVGVSLEIMKKIKKNNDNDLLLKNYFKKEFLKEKSSIENQLNVKIKKLTNGKTCVSFKYSIIERLKEIGCPDDIISEIIGVVKKQSFYHDEISFDNKSSWLNQIMI